jgi:hypothetical protein
MALDDVFNVTSPNAINGADTTYAEKMALIIEEFTGMVEGTIARRSIMQGMVPVRPVQGTATFTNHAVGESTLQKATAGVTPDGTKNDFSKNAVTVDTVVLARAVFGLLEPFQTQMNTRQEVATEHGKKIAKFWDESFLIQAAKAALLTQSTFSRGSAGKPAGHFGGSQETLAAAGDLQDPAKLYAALARLLVKMEKKDVDPRNDDCMIIVDPAQYYTLIQAEQLVNTTYTTAAGNQVNNAWVLKTYGVPVFSTNNAAIGKNITGHLLSNSGNSNAYDGDFTKVGAQIFSPRAIMAGETIPLQSEIFYDKISKSWFVDAHLSYAVGPNRAEYAGAILLP